MLTRGSMPNSVTAIVLDCSHLGKVDWTVESKRKHFPIEFYIKKKLTFDRKKMNFFVNFEAKKLV